MKTPCDGCQLECPSNGCARWRDWWIENWNRNICRRTPGTRRQREFFQYEHPDLTRQRSCTAGEAEEREDCYADDDAQRPV